jgi:hypothetical protein
MILSDACEMALKFFFTSPMAAEISLMIDMCGLWERELDYGIVSLSAQARWVVQGRSSNSNMAPPWKKK